MIDDGVRLINIEGKGGRRGLLKLLGRNRQEITLSLLDPDNDVVGELKDAGFSESTIEGNVFYIGEKEYEDAFADEDLCICLSEVWPRVDGMPWADPHLKTLRENADTRKFSKALLDLIYQNTETGPDCRKPVLGVELAKRCSLDRVPGPICRLFELARQIAGAQ
jgi:hypothetical protein